MATGNIPNYLWSDFASQINSTEFIPNRLLPKFDQVPVKKHKLKRWMTKSNYHQRIQKKWNKEHGFEAQRTFFGIGGKVYGHPENIEFVKSLI